MPSLKTLLNSYVAAEIACVKDSASRLVYLCTHNNAIARLVRVFLDIPSRADCEAANEKFYRHSGLVYIASKLGYTFDVNSCDCSGNLAAIANFITDYFIDDGQFYVYLDNKGAIAVISCVDEEDPDITVRGLLAFLDRYAKFWAGK